MFRYRFNHFFSKVSIKRVCYKNHEVQSVTGHQIQNKKDGFNKTKSLVCWGPEIFFFTQLAKQMKHKKKEVRHLKICLNQIKVFKLNQLNNIDLVNNL